MTRTHWTIVWVLAGLVVVFACCIISSAVGIIVFAARRHATMGAQSTAWDDLAEMAEEEKSWEQLLADIQAEKDAAVQWTPEQTRAKLEAYIFQLTPDDDDAHTAEVLRSLGEELMPQLVAVIADPANRGRLAQTVESDDEYEAPSLNLDRALALAEDPIPGELVAALVPLLEESNSDVRAAAFAAIARARSRDTLPVIERALADPAEVVVLRTLLGLAWPEEPLRSLDDDVRVRLFDAVMPHAAHPHPYGDYAPDILLRLDPERATAHFLTLSLSRPENSDLLASIASAWARSHARVARERLVEFDDALASMPSSEVPPMARADVAYLLALHQVPDDAARVRAIVQWARAQENVLSFTSYRLGQALLSHQGFHGALDVLHNEGLDPEVSAGWSESVRHLSAAARVQLYARGGALEFYFEEPTGDGWSDALAGLRTIGAHGQRAAFERAVALFGRAGPSPNREIRIEQLDAIRQDEADPWSELEAALSGADDPFELLAAEYIVAHPELFEELRADPWQ